MERSLQAIRVILSEPQDAENVGSVCRAMKTMGITDLRIIGSRLFDLERATVVAVHAADLLESAVFHETLDQAVSGCSFVVGATRRWGKKRKTVRLTPESLGARMVQAPGLSTALVFGNESSGLRDDEIDLCHAIVTIQSAVDSRSLNLSHAVQIVCYEVYRQLHADNGGRFYQPVSGESLEALVTHLVDSVSRFGIDGERDRELLREVLGRAVLSVSESKRLSALFDKLVGLGGRRRGGSPAESSEEQR